MYTYRTKKKKKCDASRDGRRKEKIRRKKKEKLKLKGALLQQLQPPQPPQPPTPNIGLNTSIHHHLLTDFPKAAWKRRYVYYI